MLIVLEGVDGAGKTTLTERLLHQFPDAIRLHSGPLKEDPFRAYEWRLRDYRPDSSQVIITDRWHVGELIYGPLYRGASKLTAAGARHVEMYLDKLGAHKLVVTADIGTIAYRLRTRGEDFLQDNHVGLVWDFYNEYAVKEGWTRVGSDELLHHITGEARRKRAEARKLWEHKTYIGPAHPKHLLLGDEHGAPQHGRPHYDSAFVPYNDTSGYHLIAALEDVGLRDYGIANAREEDVFALWQRLGRPNVVALGAEAEKASRAVPHQTVHHPQYMRRFHHGDRIKYGHEIKELLRA